MSTVEMHAPFTTFSGTIGKLVYRKVRGRTIVAVKPDPDRPLSQAEVAHRQDFAQAATWAKAAMQDDELRPFYEALGKQRDIPARAAAISDYLKRPTLEGLDLAEFTGQAGDRIYFMAGDNAGWNRVRKRHGGRSRTGYGLLDVHCHQCRPRRLHCPDQSERVRPPRKYRGSHRRKSL